jgi:hypothetical protein
VQRLLTAGEVLLAQRRQVAVAIEAIAAMRVPRQDDVATGTLDDAGRLVAEQDRHRRPQRAINHLEVGAA